MTADPAPTPAPRAAPHYAGRPGRLLDILGEVGAYRVAQADRFAPRDDGTGPGNMVPVALLHTARAARARHGVLPGGEDTWALLALGLIAEVCIEHDPALLRVELVQAIAALVAWVEDIDDREAPR